MVDYSHDICDPIECITRSVIYHGLQRSQLGNIDNYFSPSGTMKTSW